MGSNEVLLSVQDNVATLTMNRPDALNSLNAAMLKGLIEALEQVEDDDDVRVVIVTGTGDRAFCAGTDLREMESLGDKANRVRQRLVFPFFRRLAQFGKPTIAAVNGVAYGGGMEIAVMCDLRVASEASSFGLREVKWAIIPSGGALPLLPLLIGMGRAKELVLTGKSIDAQEALRIGLVNSVVPQAKLLEHSRTLAFEICEAGPIAVRQAKKVMDLALDTSVGRALGVEASYLSYFSEDRIEGLKSFKEKRKPRYQGK